MRCPKCGYISFDHLEECLKCKKNIQASSSSLDGFVLNVKAPSFLNLQAQQEEVVSENEVLGEEFADKDLDVLVEDDEPDVMAEISLGDDKMDGLELAEETILLEDEDKEIEIDLSQFETAPEPEVVLEEEPPAVEEAEEEVSINLDMPEELADVSDLAPPKKEPEGVETAPVDPAEADFPDLELDDLNFDLGLDDLESELPATSMAKEETLLALDDIDFPDTLAPGGAQKKQGKAGKNLDDDLDIELDLGGLSIHNDA